MKNRLPATILVFLACLAGCSIPPQSERSETLVHVCGSGRANLLVFIHGFTGDSEATWKNTETEASWPRLVCNDKPFGESATVYAVRYDSSFIRTTSTMSEIAQRLRGQLQARGFFEKYRQIYLIGHSMGGLVAKKLLLDLHRRHDIDDLRRVRAVLFLATPQQGAPAASIAALFTMNPLVRDLSDSDFNDYLQTLEDDWQTMLRDRDAQGWIFPLSYCAYEGVRVIVSRTHAATRCDDTATAFPLDHSEIAKPRDREADVYVWARAGMERAASVASTEPKKPDIAAPPPRALVIEPSYSLDLLGLPIAVVPFSTIPIIHIREGRKVEISYFKNSEGKTFLWPTEHIRPGGPVGRIEIANHGDTGLFNLSYVVRIHVGTQRSEGGITVMDLKLPLVDVPAGGRVSFSVVNQSSLPAMIELGDRVIARVQGEQQRRTITVSPRRLTFSDQIPALPASLHHWLGDTIIDPDLWKDNRRKE